MSQSGDHLALDWDAVSIYLAVERVTEDNNIVVLAGRGRIPRLIAIEPESHTVEKVKAGPVHDSSVVRLLLGPEKDGCGEQTHETAQEPAVMWAVFRKAEEIQHLGACIEMDLTCLVPDGQSGNPNRNEPVLAEGQAELRMSGDLQEETAVSACMQKLILWRPTERDAAEHERSSIVGEILLPVVSLLANESNRFEMFETAFRDTDGRQEGSQGCKRAGTHGAVSRCSGCACRCVPEVCQNCM